MKDISDVLDAVVDEQSFLLFVQSLIADCKQHENQSSDMSSSGGWANNTICDFLEGALSWAEDSDFGVEQDEELATNKWRQFAVFLYCGKIYE
ncbi:hypothetical protein [Celerinatantimonas sp. MCCC 1A17872]|uniref:DUF7660 family protein n=1 Tax=Celerinatantimonas sp. MCCC 1A17872 TaxID=3177514 RepID=UPI0038C10736